MSIQQNRSKRPFVLLPMELLRKDFRELSNIAKMLWIYLRADYNPRKERISDLTGNAEVSVSYNYLKKIKGFKNPNSVAKAFKELINAGLIEKSTCGGIGKTDYYSFKGKYEKFPNQKKKK